MGGIMKIKKELEGEELKRKLDLLSPFISGPSTKDAMGQISNAMKRDTKHADQINNKLKEIKGLLKLFG